MFALFGIDSSAMDPAAVMIQFGSTMDVSDGVDSTEIGDFFNALSVDTTGLDIDLIVDTVNATLTGTDIDYATIFAGTIHEALTVVGVTDVTEAEIAAYLGSLADFDPFSIGEEDVTEFFSAMGVDTATLDQTLLLEALRIIGVDLVPTAAEIQAAVSDILGISLKTSDIQAWLDDNVVVGDIEIT